MNNFILFVENFTEYEDLTKKYKKEYYNFFLQMKDFETNEERVKYLSMIEGLLNVKNLNYYYRLKADDDLGIKLFEKYLNIFKYYISLIINIEYESGKKKWNYLKKEYKKYESFRRTNSSIAVKKDKKAREKGGMFYWKSQTDRKKLICPYCNIQYLNYNNGYSEVDHIYAQVSFPGLINIEVNHLTTCRKCNNAKKENIIDFSIDDLYKLHNGTFLSDKLKFSESLISKIDTEAFQMEMKKLSKRYTSNSKKDAAQTREKLDEISVYMLLSGFSNDNNLHKLKILERYQSLYKILIRMYHRFNNNILIIQPEIEKAISIYGEKHEKIYKYMFSTNALQGVFDDYDNIEREQIEVIYYWRKEFIKALIFKYIEELNRS
ncbi:HNH endonuclease signature motif containing protein [Mollicutes bacterium LVI A0078]|nr:HNH endonuclease signature motif containing protein [Mollicutes bacterium LVI A0075]WOO90181.1 HNH endonuclease signature motif containing protein [Mollicutes bacterium LVI A0078]